ncbi:MAG: hypothetical protein A3F18_01225 [Legionellales bacterium RIFCSPHIGHO2_12_FULL_37_14]|nr:MAG: hypothetical protein A3F18_01225 [Legionellales bacterium RIFCSPHIGHO2_12_FULL_37_14]
MERYGQEAKVLQLRKLWSKTPIVAVSFDTKSIFFVQLRKVKQSFCINYYAHEVINNAEKLNVEQFAVFLASCITLHKLKHAHFAWSIKDKLIKAIPITAPRNLTPIEMVDFIKFDFASHNKHNSFTLFDFQILGSNKEQNDKQDVLVYVTHDLYVKNCLESFKLAKLKLTYLDIESFVLNAFPNPVDRLIFKKNVNKTGLIQAASSFVLPCALAMRALEAKKVNMHL